MIARKAILDTNLLVDYLARGQRAELVEREPLARYLCSVVHLELLLGAHGAPAQRAVARLAADFGACNRLAAPSGGAFERAGHVLRRLAARGREVRRSSLVNDVLIAMTARSIGATVFTVDADFAAIREIDPFQLEIVS